MTTPPDGDTEATLRQWRASGASVYVQVSQEQASGLLVLVPGCSAAVLVTAAHVLKSAADEAAARKRAAALGGIAIRASVQFRADPATFWRFDPTLDLLAVGVHRLQQYQPALEMMALRVDQLASVRQLCEVRPGSPLYLAHFLCTPPNSHEGGVCTARDTGLRTKGGAPLSFDYTAAVAAGVSGAGVYDSHWHLVAVHVRGNTERHEGRGVSTDALRALLEQPCNAPLSARIRICDAMGTEQEHEEATQLMQPALAMDAKALLYHPSKGRPHRSSLGSKAGGDKRVRRRLFNGDDRAPLPSPSQPWHDFKCSNPQVVARRHAVVGRFFATPITTERIRR